MKKSSLKKRLSASCAASLLLFSDLPLAATFDTYLDNVSGFQTRAGSLSRLYFEDFASITTTTPITGTTNWNGFSIGPYNGGSSNWGGSRYTNDLAGLINWNSSTPANQKGVYVSVEDNKGILFTPLVNTIAGISFKFVDWNDFGQRSAFKIIASDGTETTVTGPTNTANAPPQNFGVALSAADIAAGRYITGIRWYGLPGNTEVIGFWDFNLFTNTNLDSCPPGALDCVSVSSLSSDGSLDLSSLLLTQLVADTQQSLINTASVLQGTFTLQNSVMVNGFTYDCSLFDKRGICVSAGGRNTTVQAQGINNTSGLLIASYRLDKNNSRIGAWVDQNLSVSGPGTVQLNNSTPMIGLFGVWSQRPDGIGAEVKVSAAYGQKDTTINRQIVGLSEAGSGGSQLISQGAQVVAKYGFTVLPDVVLSPYAGVRYTQNNMGGYTESTSSAVTVPLTYSALNTNATTALVGAEARYRGIPKTTLFASAGVETDTNTNNGSYTASGLSGLTPVNFNPNPVKTRPTATVGGYYDILKNQRIGIAGIYRQEAYQAVSTTTVLATYTVGF